MASRHTPAGCRAEELGCWGGHCGECPSQMLGRGRVNRARTRRFWPGWQPASALCFRHASAKFPSHLRTGSTQEDLGAKIQGRETMSERERKRHVFVGILGRIFEKSLRMWVSKCSFYICRQVSGLLHIWKTLMLGDRSRLTMTDLTMQNQASSCRNHSLPQLFQCCLWAYYNTYWTSATLVLLRASIRQFPSARAGPV